VRAGQMSRAVSLRSGDEAFASGENAACITVLNAP
jgi:hypothetical protein